VNALSFFKKGTIVITVVRYDAISGLTAVYGVVRNGKNEKTLYRGGHDSGRNLEMVARTLSGLGAKWYRGQISQDSSQPRYEEIPKGEFIWKPCEAPEGAPR
jgi:hypothetical protein